MLSLAQGRELIRTHVAPLDAAPCALAEAHGRVLREDVHAREDFPAFDRSSMDGYAIARDDDSAAFRVIGEVQPGAAEELEIRRGECVRIFTGAAIPRGASQVIMQEDVRREGELMIPETRDDRLNIRLRGEDARAGDRLLASGARLGAGEVALLAQAGCVRVMASPPPRVIHVTTGGELVPPEDAPARGQIRDSNSTLVAALLRDAGAQLGFQGRSADDPAALRALIAGRAPSAWDVLLISGGASVGDYDFGARVLRELGFEIVFSGLNLKPGKPLVFARRERQVAFVIPGNPVSHFVTFHVAMRAAIELLQGAEPSWPLVPAALQAPLPAFRDARETYWPARLSRAGELRVRPLKQQSSGDLGALVGANALIRIAPPCAARAEGERVECLWL
ncbi:MAG TPA: gephyrin-like molybdotransferase Glp [Chthoniobacteraceae bacterium]|jgi:molybdopterin molybdotransferase|nr:gephyrin-like molybdotransferase Glp [Chthoniobacteraceae bacterium]